MLIGSIRKVIKSISYNYAVVADTISYRNKIVSHISHMSSDIPIYISTRLVKWYTDIDEEVPVAIALLNKQGNPVILINETCEHYQYKDIIFRHELGHIRRGHLTGYHTLSKLEKEQQADIYAVNILGISKVLSWLMDYKNKLSNYPETKKIIDCRIKYLMRIYRVDFSSKLKQ